MERDYLYPKMADRDDPRSWENAGARSAWDRAREEARRLLAQPHPTYLSTALDLEIRSRFPMIR
jgi:trimethylamine--corrinoid protein Co-methyltransferase